MTVSSSLNWILIVFVCWSWKLMQNLFVSGKVVQCDILWSLFIYVRKFYLESCIVSVRVPSKVRVPILCLNKITTDRLTCEAEILSDISFTFPHSHQVCLVTYSDISIYQALCRKKLSLAHNHSWFHFEHLHWKRSTDLWGALSSLGRDGSLTVLNQDYMVDVEEFPSSRNSRDSWLWKNCKVEHCHAKESVWSTILVSCTNSLLESLLSILTSSCIYCWTRRCEINQNNSMNIPENSSYHFLWDPPWCFIIIMRSMVKHSQA